MHVQERTITAGRQGDVSMPMLGFGTAGMSSHTDQAVAWALESGYRLLDSAQARLSCMHEPFISKLSYCQKIRSKLRLTGQTLACFCRLIK